MYKTKFSAVFTGILFLTGGTVFGQIASGTYSNPTVQSSVNMQSIITNNTVNSIIMQGAMKGKTSRRAPSSAVRNKNTTSGQKNVPTAPKPSKLADTFFVNSGKFLMTEDFARSFSKNQTEFAQRKDFFETSLRDFDQNLLKSGEKPNDVARSTYYLAVACIDPVYGKTFNLQRKSIYEKIRITYENSPEFASLDNEKKQKLYELGILLTVMIEQVQEAAQKSDDSQIKEKAKTLTIETFEKFMGFSMEDLKIYPDRVDW